MLMTDIQVTISIYLCMIVNINYYVGWFSLSDKIQTSLLSKLCITIS